MQELEVLFVPLKTGSAEFNLDHIRTIADEDAKYWRFLDWWKMPEIKKDDIEGLKYAFHNLQEFDEDLITRLYSLLKNIEIVSCIFRFVSPEDYSIFSTPVEDLLNIKGRTPVLKYLSYLRDLKELRKIYHFERAADVDMALWTLAHLLNSAKLLRESPYKKLYESYIREPNAIKHLMARNALEQIWGEKKYIHIADLILQTDFILAGILAGRELELHVKDMCNRAGIPLTFISDAGESKRKDLRRLARDLFNSGRISAETKARIYDWWSLRCNLTHDKAISVGEDRVRRMVEGVIDFMRK